jgi:hypothetical protein
MLFYPRVEILEKHLKKIQAPTYHIETHKLATSTMQLRLATKTANKMEIKSLEKQK